MEFSIETDLCAKNKTLKGSFAPKKRLFLSFFNFVLIKNYIPPWCCRRSCRFCYCRRRRLGFSLIRREKYINKITTTKDTIIQKILENQPCEYFCLKLYFIGAQLNTTYHSIYEYVYMYLHIINNTYSIAILSLTLLYSADYPPLFSCEYVVCAIANDVVLLFLLLVIFFHPVCL